MKKSKVELTREQNGWLLKLMEGDPSILDDLYGSKYDQLSQDERQFEPAKSLTEALEFVESIAKDRRYEV